MRWKLAWMAALGVLLLASRTGAEIPYPSCQAPACTDPDDYGSYLFLPPGVLPDDYAFDPAAPENGSGWKYADARLPDGSPGTGMSITAAWQMTTGRPDVVVAVLDSGIRWGERELAGKLAPNLGELPEPCPGFDCDGNGVVNPADWAGTECAGGVVDDANANGHFDGQDLILRCSDGVDDDGNGFVDDIAGWDFWEDDNDPDDDVDAGHGTGEGQDMVAEANNGGGFPGVAPSAMFVPVRVGDHFVALDQRFVLATVYAVDRGVDVVSEALGALGASRATEAAVRYAYERGVPVIASAADEQSRHHNWPAAAAHTVWVNSIRNGDGDIVGDRRDFRIQNGCTNHGGKAWVAISSTSCSSEATGRAAGMALLLISHGKNLMEAGALEPYPETLRPYSAEEVRQIFRAAAQDVDRSLDPAPAPGPVGGLLGLILSGPGLVFGSERFAHGPGWDEYSGYGRPDMQRMLEIATDAIPPEAAFTRSPGWFDVIDPARPRWLPVRASTAAVRTPGTYRWSLEVGCGVVPGVFQLLREGSENRPLRDRVFHRWRPGETAERCGFDFATPITSPDAHSVTLRLRVVDAAGNLGEDRRTVAIHADPTQRFVRRIGSSGEGSPVLADVNRDGVLDIVYGANDGRVHVLKGRNGRRLPGFPARTESLLSRARFEASPAWYQRRVPIPREALVATVAADDLDGDGRVEIVAASVEGNLWVFDDRGRLWEPFPVSSDPAFSAHERRDRFNDVGPGFASSPSLVDLDAPGGDGDLEIVVAGLDGYLYAWRHDGSPVAGFPVRLGDRTKLSEDPVTGKWIPLDNTAEPRLAKVISSPAVGDLDGDGTHEIVIGTNEEYRDGSGLFSTDDSGLLQLLSGLGGGLGDFAVDTAGRIYVVDASGGVLPGFPARVPLLAPGLLPTVATGTPGSPALARLDASGGLVTAIFSAVGPVMLLRSDGSNFLGLGSDGAPLPLAPDFAGGGFPLIPDPAGLNEPGSFSFDAPFLGALGSGAFGDVTGDGAPEYTAPTGGVRQLIDVATPASQEFGDHQVAVWDPRSGDLLPQFPRVMDDMQFLTEPALADVDGDGIAELIHGSGAYLVRAYTGEGRTPQGWPKFTGGWVIGTPAAGDVDGDGRIEVVVVTREGRLFVWDTPARASEKAIPWQGFGRDRRNTRNHESGVSPLAEPRERPRRREAFLRWILEYFGLGS